MNVTYGTPFHRRKVAKLNKLIAWAEREAAKVLEDRRLAHMSAKKAPTI